jgi:peptide-methionine (S)-S-oxide reductase
MEKKTEIATLGGGCFWCVEAVLEQLRGVEKVVSGYAGGKSEKPTYRQVCNGDSGHIEVVQVTFDPSVVSYRDLLGVFFTAHDPTSMDQQGADRGVQYRSIIYVHSPEQEKTARELVAELTKENVFPRPIVTKIEPVPTFWPGEEYHQGYYRANSEQGYCQAVIAPKLAKFRKLFADRAK